MSVQPLPAQANQFFHYLFEQASLGIAVEDLEGKLLLANPSLCSMLGYSENEMLAMSCSQFANPEDSADDWALFQELRAGFIDKYSLEKRYVRKDGTQVWGNLNVSLLKNSEAGSPPLVFAFVEDITKRKRAEEELRRRDVELSEAHRLAGVGTWRWEARTDTVIWSKELYRLMGIDPTLPAPSYKEHALLFAAESWERLQRAVQRTLQTGTPYELDLEVVRPESIAKWEIARGEAVRDADGQIVGLHGTVQDITERKSAEAALANVSRKLIEAQEQERTRIGRDLHDDVGQRLALLAVELRQLQDHSGTLPDVRSRIGKLHKQASAIAADIQSLSHELHSAKLQYLGIAPAMRGFCQEFSQQERVEIEFHSRDLPAPLSADISLGLFRVLQEALHNSAKHSGARHFEVRLWGATDEVHLTVKDSGAGFDLETAKVSRGLGLTSMEERLKLLNGRLSIESLSNRGTTIHACVPLGSARESMRAAG